MNKNISTIVVAGGIGCGKSVVCKILSIAGYAVYDCDSRAKTIMDERRDIIERIASEICGEAVIADGERLVINRKRLADEVFNDVLKLQQLNALVHDAVKCDIRSWLDDLARCAQYPNDKAFIETALLKQSGIDRLADEVWEVWAPHEIRVERAMKRDKSDRQAVEARIKSQEVTSLNTSISPCNSPDVKVINNDGYTPVLPQILRLLGKE